MPFRITELFRLEESFEIIELNHSLSTAKAPPTSVPSGTVTHLLNPSRAGDSNTALGSLAQCLTMPWVTKFSLIADPAVRGQKMNTDLRCDITGVKYRGVLGQLGSLLVRGCRWLSEHFCQLPQYPNLSLVCSSLSLCGKEFCVVVDKYCQIHFGDNILLSSSLKLCVCQHIC